MMLLRGLVFQAVLAVSLGSGLEEYIGQFFYDVTSDDYPLDELSIILQDQQRSQMRLQQRQRELAEAEEKFGAEEMAAAAQAEAAAATAAAEASAAASAREGGEGRTRPQRLPPFQQHQYSFELPSSSGRGRQQVVQQQRMSDAMVPDSLAGFQPGSGVAQEPAFSYREPAGQAADGEAAPFAVSPKDPRFYEDAPSQIAELAGGDVYRSRDYGFRGGEEGAGAGGDVGAAAARAAGAADNSMWAERPSDLVQQPAPPAVPLAQVPQSAVQQPGQTQRGRAKADGSSGSSGAKKTGMEPMAAAAGDSVRLGQSPSSGAGIPSRAMDREAPPGAVGPPAAVPPAGAASDVGSVGGPPSASDVAARAKAGADAAAHAYQSARGKGLPENEDDEEEAVMATAVQSDLMSGQIKQKHMAVDNSDVYFIAIVAGCCAAAAVGIIGVGISWYRLQKNAKAAADVEYPAYGVTGPKQDISPTSGDRRLAQSAQMYHYQHQKQQIIAMESRIPAERNGSVSDAESDEENEEGDYTVYECPGLAPTGEMEVKNPLFQDDPTPATPAAGPGLGASEEATSTVAKDPSASLSVAAAAAASPKSSTKGRVNGEKQKQKP